MYTRSQITAAVRDMAGHAIITERIGELDVRVPILSVEAVHEMVAAELPATIRLTVSSMTMWEHLQIVFCLLRGVHWHQDMLQ